MDLRQGAAGGQTRSPGTDEVMVVMAHGLLNSVAVIRNAAELIVRRGDHDEVTIELLGTIVDQAVVVAESLKDMIRGAPDVLLDALDELDRYGASTDVIAGGGASHGRSNADGPAAPRLRTAEVHETTGVP